MTTLTAPRTSTLTAVDLAERFGPIPLSRIGFDPPPGRATEQDVFDLHDREGRLYELVEGILVEKAVGYYESYLAMLIGRILGNFADRHRLGIVAGADGMMRLAPGLIRIPDVSFIAFDRLPDGRVPRAPAFDSGPDLAVEVLSASNTKKEMDLKLRQYFESGVRLVWFVDPVARRVTVYQGPERSVVLGEDQTIDGGEVLPGFALPVQRLFAEPFGPPPAEGRPGGGA